MYTFQCNHCQKTFQNESKTRKYCSRECQKLAYKITPPRPSDRGGKCVSICRYCQKEFSGFKRANRKYCSLECSNLASKGKPNEKNRNRVNVVCECCGKVFSRTPSHVGKRNFCSRQCRKDAPPRLSPTLDFFKCIRCEKEFSRRKGGASPRTKTRFCSKECFQEWAKVNKRTGQDNPLFTSVSVQCSTCGKAILRAPYRAKEGIENFCDMTCYGQWRSDNLVGGNNPVWKGGDQVGYRGPNWKKQSTAARKRDSYRCQSCGTHEKKLDRLLDVHHIKPFREFGYIPDENDNYLQANELSNLISLCPSCHKSAEWRLIPLQPMLLWQE